MSKRSSHLMKAVYRAISTTAPCRSLLCEFSSLPTHYQYLTLQPYSDYALTHHNINVYLVYTTAIIRKYTVWFDFAWSALPTVLWRCLPFTTGVQKPSTAYTIHSFKLWRVAYKAFSAHASQWEGPRTLFLYLNRYMWYNELVIHQIGR